MDTTSYVTLIIIAFVIIILIIFSVLRSKQKKEKYKREFLAIGEANGIKISNYDRWNHYAIGIDNESKKILYLDNVSNTEKPLIISLDLVKSAEAVEVTRTVNTNSGKVIILDQLKLKLSFRAKDTADIFLEFFHSEINSHPSNEIELMEKWRKIIDSH